MSENLYFMYNAVPYSPKFYVSSIYDMTLFTYLFAFGHFSSELLIFRTAKINPGVMSPVVVASTCPHPQVLSGFAIDPSFTSIVFSLDDNAI